METVGTFTGFANKSGQNKSKKRGKASKNNKGDILQHFLLTFF